jgi:hypothetical protein
MHTHDHAHMYACTCMHTHTHKHAHLHIPHTCGATPSGVTALSYCWAPCLVLQVSFMWCEWSWVVYLHQSWVQPSLSDTCLTELTLPSLVLLASNCCIHTYLSIIIFLLQSTGCTFIHFSCSPPATGHSLPCWLDYKIIRTLHVAYITNKLCIETRWFYLYSWHHLLWM